MDEAGTSREQLLIRAFVGLADTLVDDYDVIDLLDRLVGYSVELLAADAAGILLADPHGALRVVASSNEQTEWIELMQLQADQGPCVECFRSGAPVSITDLADAAIALAAAGRRPRRPERLPLRARAAAAAARRGHRRDEPVPPPARSRYPPPTWRWGRRWPTWPPSGSCRNAPSAAARCSTSNSRPR